MQTHVISATEGKRWRDRPWFRIFFFFELNRAWFCLGSLMSWSSYVMVHEKHSALCYCVTSKRNFVAEGVVIDISKSLSQIEVVSINTVLTNLHVNNLHHSTKSWPPRQQPFLSISFSLLFIYSYNLLHLQNSTHVMNSWLWTTLITFRFRVRPFDSCKLVVVQTGMLWYIITSFVCVHM